jgi:hypothetical protein
MLYLTPHAQLIPETSAMKTAVQVVIFLALMSAAGYYAFQQYRQAHPAPPPPPTAAALAAQKLQAAHQQDAAALAKQQADLAKQQAAEAAVRQDIEGTLKTLKVSSILPGEPGIVIIDKHEYAEGDDLPVGKGRKLRVTHVQEDGVLLASNGLTFHLDPPAAPDLAASRKAR